jgi:hypothetical protein
MTNLINIFNNKFAKYFSVLVLMPIAIYFHTISTYALNYPHWDDYEIMDLVNTFNRSNGFFEKIKIIFSQHNEHRLVYTHAIFVLQYLVFGKINFVVLIWVGSCALLGIFYIFYKLAVLHQWPFIYLLPVSLTLFQLGHYENTYWAMASLGNLAVVLFMALAIWQISHNKIPYFWMFMAVFSSGSPVIILPIFGVVVFYLKTSKYNLRIFTLFAAVLVLVFYIIYTQPPYSQYLVSKNPFDYVYAFFSFFGSSTDVNLYGNPIQRLNTAAIFGLASLGIILFLMFYFFKNIFKTDNEQLKNSSYFLAGLLFIGLVTSAIIAVTRLNFGMPIMLLGRYKVYSILCFCTLYMLILLYVKKKPRFIVFSICCLYTMAHYMYSYYYCSYDIAEYRKYEIGIYRNNYIKNNGKLHQQYKGIYNYQKTFLDTLPATLLPKAKYTLNSLKQHNGNLFVSNTNFKIGKNLDDGAYLQFKNKQRSWIFATRQAYTQNKRSFYKNGLKYGQGFAVELREWELPAGKYQINILEKNGNKLLLHPCNHPVFYKGNSIK